MRFCFVSPTIIYVRQGQMYPNFCFKDKRSTENYLKLHAPAASSGVTTITEAHVILPHEVILVAVVEYTNKDPHRVQAGRVVSSVGCPNIGQY